MPIWWIDGQMRETEGCLWANILFVHSRHWLKQYHLESDTPSWLKYCIISILAGGLLVRTHPHIETEHKTNRVVPISFDHSEVGANMKLAVETISRVGFHVYFSTLKRKSCYYCLAPKFSQSSKNEWRRKIEAFDTNKLNETFSSELNAII